MFTTHRISGCRGSVSLRCKTGTCKRVSVDTWRFCFYDQELGRALKNNRGLRDSNSQLARQVILDIATLSMDVWIDTT